MGGRRIWADKAVISACDVHQTFLKLVGPRHLDPAILRKIEDISLKNQTLYVSTFHTKKPMRFNTKFQKFAEGRGVGPHNIPSGAVYPVDSREMYYADVADVDGLVEIILPGQLRGHLLSVDGWGARLHDVVNLHGDRVTRNHLADEKDDDRDAEQRGKDQEQSFD